jgi:hypothetical protein
VAQKNYNPGSITTEKETIPSKDEQPYAQFIRKRQFLRNSRALPGNPLLSSCSNGSGTDQHTERRFQLFEEPEEDTDITAKFSKAQPHRDLLVAAIKAVVSPKLDAISNVSSENNSEPSIIQHISQISKKSKSNQEFA